MSELLHYLLILITSLTPGIEVRGSIPLAFMLFNNESERFYGTFIGITGNLLISPLLLTFLDAVDHVIRGSRRIPQILRTSYIKVLNYVEVKSVRARRYSFVGLLIFTAVPFPGTGAWTASLVAFIIRMSKVKAIAAIELGVLVASLIVLAATYLGLEILKAIFLIS